MLENGDLLLANIETVVSEYRDEDSWSAAFWSEQHMNGDGYQLLLEDGRCGDFKIRLIESGEPNLVQVVGLTPLTANVSSDC